MKNLLLFFLIGISMSAFGQSKKEQLLILNSRLDSLNKEHSTLSNQYAEAQEQIKDKSNTITSLNSKNTELVSEVKEKSNIITSLNSKNKDLMSEIEAVRKAQEEQIAMLTHQLDSFNNEAMKGPTRIKLKSDSVDFDKVENTLYHKGKLFTGILTVEDADSYGEINYKDGKEDGLGISWYTNGQLKGVSNSKEGKLAGYGISWHKNSQINEIISYKDVGYVRVEFYKNGQIDEISNYNEGVDIFGNERMLEDGPVIGLHENGQLAGFGNYKDGRKLNFKLWDINGNPVEYERAPSSK